MEDVKVVNSFCDVTYDFGIHFALLNVKCMLRYSHLHRWGMQYHVGISSV